MNLTLILPQLIKLGRQWIGQQRMAYRPAGHELSEMAFQEFSRFFAPSLLKQVRLVTVPAIENPPFLAQLGSVLALARVPVLDFSSMAALTLVDTVLLTEKAARSDLDSSVFHELVHVVQYDLVGLDKFVDLFINGWVNQGFNYPAIPLEMDACEMQYRYEGDPGLTFDVQEEVSRRLELLLED
jgi:hypothetical protein